MNPEATVIAVAVAIYLFDCVVLLERGQALWSRGVLSFGSIHYQVRGKVVALLNPFAPFIPVLRTQPLFCAAPEVTLSRALQSLRPMVAMSLLQFMLVFVVLPYCLYRAPGWPFLIALVLAYLNAIAMLGYFWWRFTKEGIPTRPLLALGFGWLVCLPLSVNCLRRAGLAFDIAVDARRAIRFLPERHRRGARAGLAAQAAEALQDLDEEDASRNRLFDLKRQLEEESGDERN